MVRYVFNCWRDRQEMLLVRRQFYPAKAGAGDEDGAADAGREQRRDRSRGGATTETSLRRQQAVARVSMWMARQHCPHLVESTALLTAALLSDEATAAAGHSRHAWSTYAVRATYAAAFSRFVTGLLDGHQDKQRKQSMYAVAHKIGLPASFVELRHQSTHEQLPCRAKLRSMANKALDWIWHYYWSNLADDPKPPESWPPRCREAVLDCLRGAKTLDELARWDTDTVLAVIARLQATLPGNQAFVQCRELSGEMQRRRLGHADDAAAPPTRAEEPEPEPEPDPEYGLDGGPGAGSGWSLHQGPWKAKPIGVA